MSQEKVDRYKQEKANRQKIMKKEKRQHIFSNLVVAVVCVAIVGWAGFGIYEKVTTDSGTTEYTTTEVNLLSITDYLSEQGVN